MKLNIYIFLFIQHPFILHWYFHIKGMIMITFIFCYILYVRVSDSVWVFVFVCVSSDSCSQIDLRCNLTYLFFCSPEFLLRYMYKLIMNSKPVQRHPYQHDDCKITFLIPEGKEVVLQVPHFRPDLIHAVINFTCRICGHDDHTSHTCLLSQMETNKHLIVKNKSSDESSENSPEGRKTLG